jgi:hypothetical protein
MQMVATSVCGNVEDDYVAREEIVVYRTFMPQLPTAMRTQ